MKEIKISIHLILHLCFMCACLVQNGYAVAQLVEALCYKSKVAGSIPDGVTGFIH
jgi:hypothetical protein